MRRLTVWVRQLSSQAGAQIQGEQTMGKSEADGGGTGHLMIPATAASDGRNCGPKTSLFCMPVSKRKSKKTPKKAKAPSPGDENGFNALITVGAGPGPTAPKRPQHGSAVTFVGNSRPGQALTASRPHRWPATGQQTYIPCAGRGELRRVVRQLPVVINRLENFACPKPSTPTCHL